ncbi:MAG: hypothetical protein WBF90_12880 [Rivularia sp. (in: cyanobacteria)]
MSHRIYKLLKLVPPGRDTYLYQSMTRLELDHEIFELIRVMTNLYRSRVRTELCHAEGSVSAVKHFGDSSLRSE